MISQFKKLSALILSFVLCFNLCATAFAAETELPEENEPLILQGAAIAASIVQATTATANLIVQSAAQAPSLFINLLDEFCTFDEDVQALYGSGRRFAQAISEASTFSDVGDIIIEGVMNSKIYRFVEWLIGEFSLTPGGNSVSVVDDSGYYVDWLRIFRASGSPISIDSYGQLFSPPVSFTVSGHTFNFTVTPDDPVYIWYCSVDGGEPFGAALKNDNPVGVGIGYWSRKTVLIIREEDRYSATSATPVANTNLGSGVYKDSSLSFTPLEVFQDIPSEIPDNQGLTIDTNISDLDTSNPQTTADTIFQFIIDGNYIPVVSVGDIPVTYNPQITASQFSVTSTTFTSSVSLTGLDPSHEYKPFWALYNKADLTQVIASGYAAEIGTVTGVGSFSGYSQVTNLTPATAYLINWTLLDATANEIVPSVSNVEFTTSSGASSDDSPSILLMILNKVSEILDKMNGGQSEGILASINDKLDDLIDTVANQYERELGDNFKDSLSGVNESFFSETGKGQGVTVSNVVDLADTQSVFKGIFSGDYGFSDFLDLFSDDGFSPWFSSDTAMNLNPTAYGSPSAADLDDPYNMQSYYDNLEKVRNKPND